jgi:hypothetical protein
MIRVNCRHTLRMILSLILAPVTAHIGAAQGPNLQGLYVPPAPTFIHDPSETPVALSFGLTSLAQVQKQLDATSAANPNSPVVLTLTGHYTVTDTPLTLPSNTSLVLYGTIRADASATAPSLIAIQGQSNVSVAGGLLDGMGVDLAGIAAVNSAKVNIDAVTIINTGKDGIVLNGAGNDAVDSGSGITRCEISGAAGNGMTLSAITQLVLLDNYVHDNSGTGIQMSAAHSSIVNNVVKNNNVGIEADANDNLISDNELDGNQSGGLQLTSSSSGTAVLRNAVINNAGYGVDFGGSNNLLYGNQLQNATDLVDRSASNWTVGTTAPLNAPVSQYFYPPTAGNPQTGPIMNGRSRTDIALDASSYPTISSVQQAYNDARQQNPNDVIVLTLAGTFTLDSSPLLLQSYTVVILDGTINVPANGSAPEAITASNPSQFVAISGGTIELNGASRAGIYFPSSTMADVDGVTVKDGGVYNVRKSGSMIHFQNGGGYNILHGNTVNSSGGRCIWTQENHSRYVVLENYLTYCNMDGVDFDSSTRNSFAIRNTAVDNERYGVFIEQSDSYNTAYANFTTTKDIGAAGRGVEVYNNATSAGTRGITDMNTVFGNTSDIVGDGLRVGSISTASGGVAETAHTFMFNNIVKNSKGNGILFDTQFPNSIENYFSQTVLSGNGTDINSHPSNGAEPPEFFNPPSAINLALRQPVAASSSAAGSSPSAAVDGLGFTSWVAGSEAMPSLTIDLGSQLSFSRVMLKQATPGVIQKVVLQSSRDGATFSDLPGTAHAINMNRQVNNVSFSAVTARYLRVQISVFQGGPTGFEEISVFPQ